MSTRTKLFLSSDHATVALVENQGGGRESLISSVRFPRAEFLRLAAQAVAAQAGACSVFYGDGAATNPAELPLQPATQPPAAS